MSYFNLAIDGPAGAGKSTIAKRIAKKLGFVYVDTGAMYRAMALYFLRNNISSSDSEGIEKACGKVDVTIEYKNGEQLVILNGENVNGLIRTEEVGNMASTSSVNKSVRNKLVELQQTLAKKENVVMDGRDIGTFVLPNADLKIYLTASSQVRARRRWLELQSKGIAADQEEIEQDIIDRDNRDMNREFAPLRQAEDAIYLDSSDLSIDEVIGKIISLYENVNK
jgi:cytidylate kinase